VDFLGIGTLTIFLTNTDSISSKLHPLSERILAAWLRVFIINSDSKCTKTRH
jgi:hypothetical protein